ncbi:miniconductance mechanosensitive channel MscM [Candidatus Pantoea edessiphila]|uniref:miniconductance mechanosensitive channel MscM n=1 Tax=Candidatus Pantoea edessiphila TaxID=2044610 RepID=UPI00131A006A|nr:miniconductance mechanosensitive channel MscM [Candidatus Pantoea edessiphila]
MIIHLSIPIVIGLWINNSVSAINIIDIYQLKNKIEEKTKIEKNDLQKQPDNNLFLYHKNQHTKKIKKYKKFIKLFPILEAEFKKQIYDLKTNQKMYLKNTNNKDLNQELIKVNLQLIEEERQAQKQNDKIREISNSLSILPQLITEARYSISKNNNLEEDENISEKIENKIIYSGEEKSIRRKQENIINELYVNELELAQLSANNRQKIARLNAELHQLKITYLNNYLQQLRIKIKNQNQTNLLEAIEKIKKNKKNLLFVFLLNYIHTNQDLSIALDNQIKLMHQIEIKQHIIHDQINQVQSLNSMLNEKSNGLTYSVLLGETLRLRIAKLPEMPQLKNIDQDIAKIRLQRLHYEYLIENKESLIQQEMTTAYDHIISDVFKKMFKQQLLIKYKLINLLISGCDSLILETTKLKISKIQLQDYLRKATKLSQERLFWIADNNPFDFKNLKNIKVNIKYLFSLNILKHLKKGVIDLILNIKTFLPVLGGLFLVVLSFIIRNKYNNFLETSASKVGKVTQDRFKLTIRTVILSILMSIPLPLLWTQIGYGLQESSEHPIVVAIGDGIVNTVPVLTIFIIITIFSKPNGLFIMHFRWSQVLVTRAINNFFITLCFIVPLIILLSVLDDLEEHNLSSSLGRVCFVLICFIISISSINLKKSNIPLHINKSGKTNNFINNTIWNIIILIPIIDAIAALMGYSSTAKAILLHIEISNVIWFVVVIIYHIIRRWMLIQHRRLSFDRAKQKRAEILAFRARSEEEKEQSMIMQNADSIEIEEPIVNLDVISAQSLKLVRWILMSVTLALLMLSWSEIHLALGFFDNILLWKANASNQGNGNYHPITLGALLVAVFTFIITMQLVRNMPALIELILLQHLNLKPGTNYAISTLTKYTTILFGGLFGLSVIGIDWSKLQWLVAALGVGLGFGLQEIFANCISGLIILFERPIRIGDTVTIRNLTGSITRINTRATTITDWDRKEIIVPNKAFITEQFVNWSLSDSVTRVVLTIPTLNITNSSKVTKILKHSAECCNYVLKTPSPEAFLVDLQQGTLLFELRVYVAEMGHRMPLRHELNQLIVENFAKNNIIIPFPPFQMRIESVKGKYFFKNKIFSDRFF